MSVGNYVANLYEPGSIYWTRGIHFASHCLKTSGLLVLVYMFENHNYGIIFKPFQWQISPPTNGAVLLGSVASSCFQKPKKEGYTTRRNLNPVYALAYLLWQIRSFRETVIQFIHCGLGSQCGMAQALILKKIADL